MRVVPGYRALPGPLAEPVIALGNFDGVHRGHQKLFAVAIAAARRRGGTAAVLTFDPHPAVVLAPALAPKLITTRERKLELIAEAGVEVCLVEPFTLELAALPPAAFVEQVLVRGLGAREVVVGYDFTFGHRRQGSAADLVAFGESHGFATHVIAPVTVDGIVASSTKVRNFVETGVLDGARLLLGRDLDADGVVVRGAGRGRTIGVPTANLEIAGELLPPQGVYAVRVGRLDAPDPAVRHPGAANLGVNPTFVRDGPLTFEVHLLDFSGDLYGERLRVAFVERLRGERRFAGVDELVAQIRADCERAREILAR